MIALKTLESWLQSANTRYRREEIPPRDRPLQALRDFMCEFPGSLAFGSPIMNTIFNWFSTHSQPGSHEVGSLFTGAFYFDACFWPLRIPFVGYGTYALHVLDSLATMPQVLMDQLVKDRKTLQRLEIYWADCCDYAYGFSDIMQERKLNPRTIAFVESAHHELAGAIGQLTTPNPNARAILSLGMATEIFMKALLIHEQNLTEKQLRDDLRHNITKIARECFKATGTSSFGEIAKVAAIFPKAEERYDGKDRRLPEVWKAVRTAQTAAAAVARRYSGRDIRSQMLKK